MATRLEKLRREKRLPLKEIANEELRAGLAVLEKPKIEEKPVLIPKVHLGRKLPNLDNIAEALAAAEAESWK